MLPKFVFFFPALGQTLGSFFQCLDQDGFGHLQSRGIRLPKLQIQLGKHVAKDGRVSVKYYTSLNLNKMFFLEKFLQIRIDFEQGIGLHGLNIIHIGANDAAQLDFP